MPKAGLLRNQGNAGRARDISRVLLSGAGRVQGVRRVIFPIVMGLAGCAVLLALGAWQVQRLGWKEARLAAIDARIADAPGPLPLAPDPVADAFLPVTANGALSGAPLFVLTAHEGGPGYRVVVPFDSGGRRLLADLGFVTEADRGLPMVAPEVTLQGHLLWPDEADGWTPAPEGDLWFARDVRAMAAALGAEPVLIVVASMSGADLPVTPLPIDSSTVPNDHLGYAVTWFSLALVWAVMSGFFATRMARRPQKD